MRPTGPGDSSDPRFRVISSPDYCRYLENIIENVDLAVFMVAQDGRIAYWNARMEQLFAPREEVLGKQLTEVFPQFGEASAGVVWEDVLKKNVVGEGRTIEVRRYPLVLPSAAEIPCHVRAFPVKDPSGVMLGAGMAVRDISEEIRMEEQLLLNARTTSLAHLGASLAHEIRNPLNSLSLNLQLLREELEESGKAAGHEKAWAMVQSEIQRLNLLLKEFQEFSRPQQTKMEILNPNSVIAEALELLAQQARQKNIAVIVEYGELPEILVDRSKLVRALYNIALNAIEAVPESGRIEVVTFRRGQWVGLKIEDNGPGISGEELPKIFELFYTTKENGTGLGLTIASRFIEEQHGHITADSKPGKGAAFTIFLPVKIVST
jgi:PAS domain S-box-containing protein